MTGNLVEYSIIDDDNLYNFAKITSWNDSSYTTFAHFTCFQGAHLTACIKAFNREVTRLCSLQHNIGQVFIVCWYDK